MAARAPGVAALAEATKANGGAWIASKALWTPLAKSGRHQNSQSYLRPRLRDLGTFRPVSPIPGHNSDLTSRNTARSYVARRFHRRYPIAYDICRVNCLK